MLFVFQFLWQKTRKYVIKTRHAGLLKESILSNAIFKNPRRKWSKHIIKNSPKRNTNMKNF